MRILKGVLVVVLFLGMSIYTNAAINMTVSPIKYELMVDPGGSVTRTATLYNYDSNPIDIVTGKSDFTSDGSTGGPSFVRYSELIHPDQQLSTWISLSSSGFTIPPNESVTIDFTLNVPVNATPGGHYGAVFFKNNNAESTSGTKISINADYGILLLLTVSGDINTEIEIEEPVISNNGGDSEGGGYSKASKASNNLLGDGLLGQNNNGTDNCLIDFTNSNFDGLCFDNPLDTIPDVTTYVSRLGGNIGLTTPEDDQGNDTNVVDSGNVDNSGDVNDSGNITDSGDEVDSNFLGEDLEISFTFPIKNTGNTHVKPTGKIKLIDENGDVIKGVGKKATLNDKGAVTGVEIVDYLPINDGGGNVLPQSQRNFEEKWEGFPIQTLDEKGLLSIKNLSPGEYYTKKNFSGDKILMPWERVGYRKNFTTVKALIDLVYKNDEGKDVEYSSAKEIPIEYTEKYIGLNPYVLLPLILFIGLFLLLWIIALGKRTRCINKDCKKRIKRKLLRCPHCDTKQKKSNKKKKKK